MDIRILKELMGHKGIKTTMIYLHINDHARRNFRSPLDVLMDSG
jgi:site-specific recombinase XerD